jgi:Flp pilus assembly pilin Flp
MLALSGLEMERSMEIIHQLYRDTSGATIVEYGLMVTFIALVCAVIIGTLGQNLLGTFTTASVGVGS